MISRSFVVCALASAAFACSIGTGFGFSTFPAEIGEDTWRLHFGACALVFLLGVSMKGGRFSVAVLLVTLALCLPAIGPVLATMTALSIHFMRPAKDEVEPFIIGNPLTTMNGTGEPDRILRHPIAESIRRSSDEDLFRLLTGIGSLNPKDIRPTLIKISKGGNAQLQLLAQGGLSDTMETAERNLKALSQRAREIPDETATRCAISEIYLHLLDHQIVEEDDRPATWREANSAIAKALESDPRDASSLQIKARLGLMAGDAQAATIAAVALASIPGHCDSARLILAEAAVEAGDLRSASTILEKVAGGASDRDAILDFWRNPKPTVYA